MSEGTNALLRVGATPVTTANDIADALHLDELLPPTRTPPPPRDGVAGRIIAALGSTATPVDTLCETLAIPAHELASALTTLELDGSVRDIGGGRYIKT